MNLSNLLRLDCGLSVIAGQLDSGRTSLTVARERLQEALDELVLLERSTPSVGNPAYHEFTIQRGVDEVRNLTELIAELEGLPSLARR